jgi:signal transduction histidine kinase
MTDIVEKLLNPTDLRLSLAAESMPGESPTAADPRQRVLELTHAVASRDHFIAVVGHELRNSLAPMSLIAEQFATLAEGSQPPGRLLSRVAMLTGNLNKLIATVGRIVDVADLRRGKLLLDAAATDLVEVAREVCHEAQREAAAGGAELVVISDGPVVGRWDPARVKQIVAIGLSNALRHGGSGRIELAVHARSADGELVGELVIEDEGPGIDPAKLSHVFEFAEPGDTRRTGGLGIGLWTVKTLCAAMTGTVTVENRSPSGVRFCVTLPRG